MCWGAWWWSGREGESGVLFPTGVGDFDSHWYRQVNQKNNRDERGGQVEVGSLDKAGNDSQRSAWWWSGGEGESGILLPTGVGDFDNHWYRQVNQKNNRDKRGGQVEVDSLDKAGNDGQQCFQLTLEELRRLAKVLYRW